ncbi:pyridoxamine 5'-phosphate oxidase [Brevibacterium ravenspurgense]|uniref:Pyridoxine/pyridoxamine 5'-phosphate oxidase n=1 Tax=Brevibacterium ravenspurgense TaxID=479117 RepID=A0A2I1IEG3_9MICO|nr:MULTISPECIES: pyridoxamine 5'-phosphate oxidase [Brevibacterium]OFT92885.1 pyridoxamine 5'-phosphate oxidase [Brevibacterium sp. HMSC24B04]PKY69514.1 pyridoxamine 5'-phosphate oxidase [Brevibacterium ravenspurgense]
MIDIPDSLAELAQQRIEYGADDLDHLEKTPFEQFAAWYDYAHENLREPNAMVVATADDTGPTARLVLLKSFDERGFVFYTHYTSPKGAQLAQSPRASLVFPWHELSRQVRVRAVVEKVSPEESDAYFAQRPRGSQIGAVASHQSQPVRSRSVLEKRYQDVEAELAGRPVERPETWGGYLLRPFEVEFWQGMENRMHDRCVFTSRSGGPADLADASQWSVARLEP